MSNPKPYQLVVIFVLLVILSLAVVKLQPIPVLLIFGFIGFVSFSFINPRPLYYSALFLMVFPLFIEFDSLSSVRIARAAKETWFFAGSIPPLPLGLFLTVGAVGLGASRSILRNGPRFRFRSSHILFFLFIFASIVATVIGQFLFGFAWRNVLFFGQTVLPIIGFFLATIYVKDLITARRSFYMILIATVLTCLAIIVQSSLDYGIFFNIPPTASVRIWNFYIHGARDYFPLVIAVIVSIAIGLFLNFGQTTNFEKALLIVTFLLGSAVLSITWSKGAFLVWLVATLVFVSRKFFSLNLRTIGLIIFAICMIPLVIAKNPTTIDRMFEFFIGGDLTSITARMDYWQEGFRFVMANPIIGVGYTPQITNVAGASRIFLSHNHYLDMLIKGGIISLVPFLLLMGFILFASHRLTGRSRPFQKSFGWSIIVPFALVVFMSNMFQSNFIQPYSGIFLWFLGGFVLSLLSLDGDWRQDEGEMSAKPGSLHTFKIS